MKPKQYYLVTPHDMRIFKILKVDKNENGIRFESRSTIHVVEFKDKNSHHKYFASKTFSIYELDPHNKIFRRVMACNGNTNNLDDWKINMNHVQNSVISKKDASWEYWYDSHAMKDRPIGCPYYDFINFAVNNTTIDPSTVTCRVIDYIVQAGLNAILNVNMNLSEFIESNISNSHGGLGLPFIFYNGFPGRNKSLGNDLVQAYIAKVSQNKRFNNGDPDAMQFVLRFTATGYNVYFDDLSSKNNIEYRFSVKKI